MKQFFEINGEKIPYSKTKPRSGFRIGTRIQLTELNGRVKNTRKAQEIAESRKEYEAWKGKYSDYERDLAEYKAVINLANNNPELAEHIRRVYEQSTGQGMNGIRGNQQLPPEVAEMKKTT